MPHSDEKARLRHRIRRLRHDIPPPLRAQYADDIITHVEAIPGWEDVQRIAGYIAADGEIDPAKLLGSLFARGKQVYLPVIQPDQSLRFASWRPEDTLEANRFGIPEPLPERDRVEARELNVILMPLVGWDRRGYRLGMGGGFYDRSLAGFTGLKIGLAYSMQEVEDLPSEDWDIGMDFVATESGLHNCRS